MKNDRSENKKMNSFNNMNANLTTFSVKKLGQLCYVKLNF